MRKAILTFAVACALVAGASGMALAAGSHVAGKKCGTKYTPPCKKATKKKKHKKTPPPPTKPKIQNRPLSPKCVKVGTRYQLPRVTLTSAAGIRRIQVREGAKTIRTITFTGGKGPRQFSLKHLNVPTMSLHSGGHNLSVRVTDSMGRTVSKTLRFSVCVSTPVFTG